MGKQNDILQSQNTSGENPNNNNSNSELIERYEYEGSPITVCGNKETGYFAALGNYRLTVAYNTVKDVEQCIEDRDYNLLLALMNASIHFDQQMKSAALEKTYQGVNRTMHNDELNKQTLPATGV